ncbi:hypothetical protein [Kangiella sp. M94]
MRKILLTIVLLGFIATAPVFADSWRFEPKLDETEFNFGAVRVIRGIDSREDQRFPKFFVKVFKDGELVALYPGASFDHIVASKDNSLFVAVSNSGLPSTALMVFRSRGSIGIFLNHYQGNIRYCDESVTLVRTWYDEEEPNITFHYEGDRVEEVTINSCYGHELKITELTSFR